MQLSPLGGSNEKQAVYLLKQPVSIMNFVFLALPLVAQGLNITQRCEPSKQLGVRRAPVWPSTCKFDAVQLKVPSPSKLFPEQLFQLFHPRRIPKLLRNWNVLCTPKEIFNGFTALTPFRSAAESNINLCPTRSTSILRCLQQFVRVAACRKTSISPALRSQLKRDLWATAGPEALRSDQSRISVHSSPGT